MGFQKEVKIYKYGRGTTYERTLKFQNDYLFPLCIVFESEMSTI